MTSIFKASVISGVASEFRIGYEDWDMGPYNFQVSGDSYFSGSVIFQGSNVSGIVDPIYPSSIASRHYVDTISGNLDTRIDALGGFDQTEYITSSNAIARFHPSHLISGSEYSAAYDWFDASASQISLFVGSGGEYTAAYASSQSSKPHAYHAKISGSYLGKIDTGWYLGSSTPNTSISGMGHGFQIHPSGLILPTFSISSGTHQCWHSASNPPLGIMFISSST